MKNIMNLIAFIILIPLFLYAQIDRSKMPEPGTPPKIELDEYSTFSLSNGLKIIVVENHKLPRIALSLILDVDPVLEGDAGGYVSAAGQLLRTGTKNRTKDQLDKEIDFIGGNISTSSTGAFASSLKKHMNKITELFSDIIINSDFKLTELDKIKLRMKSDVAQSKDSPSAIAGRVSDALTYGLDHPYGEHITEQTIDNITLDKCREYYQTFFRPNAAYLAVVGDITEDEIKPLLDKYFSGWESGNVPEKKYTTPQPPEKTKVAFVDRPNSVQSVINVTYPVELKIGDEDELAATVMNTILGGGVFRLFNNLREKHSYTYGAYSSLRKDELVGSFAASADVRNSVTDSAITQILYEMNRIKNEGVEEEELTTAKNYISGNFAISLEQPQTIARFALNIQRYNLPGDYYSNYLKRIAALNANDVRNAAQKFIKPESSNIVIVGSGDAVAGKLSVFGDVEYFDIYGKRAEETSTELGGLTGDDIIKKYIEAIGGQENISKIVDRTTALEGTIQGMQVKMISYQKKPNLLRQVINAGGMEQVILFDGTAGYFIINGEKKEVTGPELEKLSTEAKVNLLLELKESGIETRLQGTETVNGKNSYKIVMKFPSGAVWTQFYDTESGLKLKEIKPVGSSESNASQETYFEDYREVSGVKYPFLLKQSVGQQNVEMKVTSIEVNSNIKEELFK